MSPFERKYDVGTDNSQGKMSSSRWQIGDTIGDCYKIYQILGGEGKAGMGIVYVCYNEDHGSVYALKTFQDKFLSSEENIKLFQKEALIWTELGKHPYIVRANSVLILEYRLFIILEYIAPDERKRNTLSHYLGGLNLSDILKFSIQFCYGMEYAYSKGLDAHRDIKPDNIMITSDKKVKITDFGLAKAFREINLSEDIDFNKQSTLSIFRTKEKKICGTLPYMAPEQFDGNADMISDIYALNISEQESIVYASIEPLQRNN